MTDGIRTARSILLSLFSLLVFCNAAWPMVLPIEVMGPDGVVETVTMTLNGKSGDALWLRVHNLSYDDKASVRINKGDWIHLRNDNARVAIAEPDESYGGIGGGFSTIRLTVDVPDEDFVEGENQIQFRFNVSDGVSSGYRILALNVLDSGGEKLLPESLFEEDDPALWEPPLPEAADIEAGKTLWMNGILKSKKTGVLQAKCASCHSVTGSDLKYFNFSNKAIITRAVFHSLTEKEGEQIASYIRSLDYYAPAQALPWNPPYQPAPGIDDRPVHEWASGGGLDAVLKNDEAMLPYLFGNGSRRAIDEATDIRSELNIREMPVAVQFPDWRLWLPRTHPMDIWGVEFWENSASTAAQFNFPNARDSYTRLRGQFENDDLANKEYLIDRVERFSLAVMWWVGDARSGHPWTDLAGPTIDVAKANGFSAEEAKLALSRWHAVKLWELLHGFDAEDKAAAIRSTAEVYQWPNNQFSVFHIAAHFIGDDRGTSAFQGEDLVTGTYFSSIWYQLQMVLNSGMRSGNDVSPVDWAYNDYHVNRLGERSGVYEPLRLMQNIIKAYQQRDREGEISKPVWSMREVSPWRIYSDYKGDQSTTSKLDDYRPGLRAQVTSSLVHQFLRKSNEYAVADWPRTSEIALSSQNWYKLEVDTYVPRAEPYEVTQSKLFAPNGAGDAVEADAMFRLIPRLADIGTEPSAVNGLIDWSKQFWPLGDWESFRLKDR